MYRLFGPGRSEPEGAAQINIRVADRLLAVFLIRGAALFGINSTGAETDRDRHQRRRHGGHFLQLFSRQTGRRDARSRARRLADFFTRNTSSMRPPSRRASPPRPLRTFTRRSLPALAHCAGHCMGEQTRKPWPLSKNFKTPDEAETGLMDMLNRKQLIMGFGHRVYRTSDPRSPVIKKLG